MYLLICKGYFHLFRVDTRTDKQQRSQRGIAWQHHAFVYHPAPKVGYPQVEGHSLDDGNAQKCAVE